MATKSFDEYFKGSRLDEDLLLNAKKVFEKFQTSQAIFNWHRAHYLCCPKPEFDKELQGLITGDVLSKILDTASEYALYKEKEEGVKSSVYDSLQAFGYEEKTVEEINEERKEHIAYICKYLTGNVTKDDFISTYKRQATSDRYYGRGNLFTECMEDILSTGGKDIERFTTKKTDLQSYAKENNFDAKLRLDLRYVDENVCANKLTEALIDIAYSPTQQSGNRYDSLSTFQGYKVNVGYPARNAFRALLISSHYTSRLIEERLGVNIYTPDCVYEAVRKDCGRCSKLTEELLERSDLKKNTQTIY